MKELLIICNALDDKTRVERRIQTDSPAASRKVFMLADVLASRETRVKVISLGRGAANRNFLFFRPKVTRAGKGVVVYLAFSHVKFLSELLSFFSLPFLIFHLWCRNKKRRSAALFYNRLPAYLLGLIISRLFGYQCFVDIEDGEVIVGKVTVKKRIEKMVPWFYDRLCTSGAILACSALSAMTSLKKTICYYGSIADFSPGKQLFTNNTVHVLMSGTIDESTGVDMLLSTLKYINSCSDAWANKFVFHVSGQGSGIDKVANLKSELARVNVKIHGRLSFDEYSTLVELCDVGLALKPVSGGLADTTFPSKVVEFASAGLLVISTNISDVKDVLGPNGALYIESNNYLELCEHLRFVFENPSQSLNIACAGAEALSEKLALPVTKEKLERFIFNQ